MAAWDDPENALAYARFCRDFPLYRDTSETLAGLAGLESARRVVDLACGTGVTARSILARLPAGGELVAVDGSAAMLDIARRDLADSRVRWVHARAEELAAHVVAPVDAVVCNSAFWQTPMPAVAAAVAAMLGPGGRFVFNIGEQFILLPRGEPPRAAPPLWDLVLEAAISDHGFVSPQPSPGPRRSPLTIESVTELIEAAGLAVEPPRIAEYEMSLEGLRAWLSVPAFTDRQLPGLSYERRMDALATAFERIGDWAPPPSRWAVFVAWAY